jgi:hypothetical protein
VESLRAFGYTLPAAVADIVDNSISAGASRIAITGHWNGVRSHIAILDNGSGMTETALVEAMRLGTRSPRAPRRADDLGRFGLGLKTASFSQCRRLTVVTRIPDNTVASRSWDLDLVVRTDEWRLCEGTEIPGVTRDIPEPSGTLVVWEALDRIVGTGDVADNAARDRFLEQLQSVKQHLGMIFHRFLEGADAIRLTFNGDPVEPWDPFLSGHEATQHLPVEELGRGDRVGIVRPYVLPHVSRLAPREHERGGGLDGWHARQGFYVYRNRRLLSPGSWLVPRLRKEEHYKLARIAVDLPNSVDLDWSIDVRKSRVRPPDYLREDLKRIAEATRRRAAEVYRHRGKVLARSSANADLLWLRKVTGGKCSYAINRDHALVRHAVNTSTANAAAVGTLLRLLEETIPIATIHIDGAERPDMQSAPFENAKVAEVTGAARFVFAILLKSGSTRAEALERVIRMEPFPLYAEAVRTALNSTA